MATVSYNTFPVVILRNTAGTGHSAVAANSAKAEPGRQRCCWGLSMAGSGMLRLADGRSDQGRLWAVRDGSLVYCRRLCIGRFLRFAAIGTGAASS